MSGLVSLIVTLHLTRRKLLGHYDTKSMQTTSKKGAKKALIL